MWVGCNRCHIGFSSKQVVNGLAVLFGGWFTVKLLYGGDTLFSIKVGFCHSILSGVEVRIFSTHHFICLFLFLLVIIIPELDSRYAVLHKIGPFFDAVAHATNVTSDSNNLDVFAELDPVLVGAVSSSLLHMVPNTSEGLREVLLAWECFAGMRQEVAV